MVAPSARREVVRYLKSRGHTERRACALASAQRSTCRYSKKKTDDPKLVTRLREIAEERPRFGYRRVHAILRREGFEVNRKRVYRIYRAAGLNVKRRSRRKLRAVRPMPNTSVTRPNDDAFTRECLAIEVDTSLPARRVVAVLDKLVWLYGLPESLRVDNGPEFISAALEKWAHAHGVKLDFIQPGKPTQNAHIESFNGHFRDECLAQARFPTLARARVEIEEWRIDYNCERPHSSLDYRTPKAFGDIARSKLRRGLPPLCSGEVRKAVVALVLARE